VLFHQLPLKPDYLRVKVRRRLQSIGAVALKNSVYVLPSVPEALEDFHWLRREIVDAGGEATLCASEFVEGVDDAQVEELFRVDRGSEYDQVLKAARSVRGAPTEPEVARLRRQLRQVVGRDYFDSPGRPAAEQAVAALEAHLQRGPGHPMETGGTQERPIGSVWVTRQGVYVDRMASAWLIARFIDPAARFKFVPAKGYRPEPGELRFDMFEGEFSHEGNGCTFETLLGRFGLRDAALDAIAEIVHDIDCKDEKFAREETEGITTVLDGIGLGHRDDEARLLAGRTIFDGLYQHFHHNR
jgi:hypothetical protein